MVETVGKKLSQARKRKKITIDEAARSTRMRPDKINDLENDNFTNFPNMTYAKSFLIIYAKFLGVDVSDFADSLATTNPVGVEEYEYLNADDRRQPNAVYRAPRGSLWPFFTAALVLMGLIAVMYFYLTLKRLVGPEPVIEPRNTVVQPRAMSSEPPGFAMTSPEPSVTILPAIAVATPIPMASPLAASTPTAPPEPVLKDVVLKPIKKTWVKITKDVADSPPIFEDWLYPDALPLKFRGQKFWIDFHDKGAIEVTKDGAVVPANGTSVVIE